jgi:hypothetical protein
VAPGAGLALATEPVEPAQATAPVAAGTGLAAVTFRPGPGAEIEVPWAVLGGTVEAARGPAARAALQAWEVRVAAGAAVVGAGAGAGGNQT